MPNQAIASATNNGLVLQKLHLGSHNLAAAMAVDGMGAAGGQVAFSGTLNNVLQAVSGAVASEVSSRGAADTSLSLRVSNDEDALTAEIGARTAADTSLSLRVSNDEDAMTSEIATRSAAVLSGSVARSVADASLSLRVSQEEDARAAADTSLSLRVSNEEDAREVADSSIVARFDDLEVIDWASGTRKFTIGGDVVFEFEAYAAMASGNPIAFTVSRA